MRIAFDMHFKESPQTGKSDTSRFLKAQLQVYGCHFAECSFESLLACPSV